MCDEPMTPRLAWHSRRSATSLTRLAAALDVPVSRFYGYQADAPTADGWAKPDEASMLTLVGSYLQSIDATAQKRFLRAVQALVETP